MTIEWEEGLLIDQYSRHKMHLRKAKSIKTSKTNMKGCTTACFEVRGICTQGEVPREVGFP